MITMMLVVRVLSAVEQDITGPISRPEKLVSMVFAECTLRQEVNGCHGTSVMGMTCPTAGPFKMLFNIKIKADIHAARVVIHPDPVVVSQPHPLSAAQEADLEARRQLFLVHEGNKKYPGDRMIHRERHEIDADPAARKVRRTLKL
ncbi:hypothetical protein ACOMHN_052942 [Nucella lapillus]